MGQAKVSDNSTNTGRLLRFTIEVHGYASHAAAANPARPDRQDRQAPGRRTPVPAGQGKDPKLNRVTVYRTLKMLKQGGLVDELDLMHYGGDQHYYETRRKGEHAHIICLRCGKVEEFFGEPLHKLRRQVEDHFGFQIVLARTEIGGYCSHCQALRKTEMEVAAAEAPIVRDASRAKVRKSAE